MILGVSVLAATAAQAEAAPPAPASSPTLPPPATAPHSSPAPAHDVVLSDETTFTTWTTAAYPRAVRAAPSAHARVLTSLRFLTSDGFIQPYVALRERQTARSDWIQVRLPMRPNGRTGWVPRKDLDSFHVVHTEIVLTLATRQLQLFRDGRLVLSAPVGVGKPGTPTPSGHFWITEKFAVHGVPLYGPYAFGTSDYSVLTDWPGGGIVGLHGTDQPQLVPGAPSHGCVRLHNSDIVRLASLVPVGTPLLIR